MYIHTTTYESRVPELREAQALRTSLEDTPDSSLVLWSQWAPDNYWTVQRLSPEALQMTASTCLMCP